MGPLVGTPWVHTTALSQQPTRGARPDMAHSDADAVSAARITAALREACAPVLHLCYADCTDGHAVQGAEDGRAIRADGRDIKALVVSSCFEGQDALQRQQLVNRILGPHVISGRLHSVQLRCWTPAQWEKQGRPQNLGQPCFEQPGSPTLAPLSGDVGEPLALQSCTAGPQPPPSQLPPAQPPLAQLPPQLPPAQPPSQPPSQPLSQPPSQPPSQTPPPQTPPPASQQEPEQSQREITAEMIVAHLQSQGEAGLASAQSILACDHASDVARRAAALVVEAAAQCPVHGAPAPPPPPRVEPACTVPGCMN